MRGAATATAGTRAGACEDGRMSWVLTILGIVVLVVLHELGHFTVAKLVGMRVERFSLFFPPTIARVRWRGTEYALGSIPAGGYVKITGMSPDELKDTDLRVATHGYAMLAPWKRIAVILAGPGVNIVIAFVLFWAILLSGSLSGASALYKPRRIDERRRRDVCGEGNRGGRAGGRRAAPGRSDRRRRRRGGRRRNGERADRGASLRRRAGRGVPRGDAGDVDRAARDEHVAPVGLPALQQGRTADAARGALRRRGEAVRRAVRRRRVDRARCGTRRRGR